MYHVECIDIHKTDAMYLYIDRACLCANNMYNAITCTMSPTSISGT